MPQGFSMGQQGGEATGSFHHRSFRSLFGKEEVRVRPDFESEELF